VQRHPKRDFPTRLLAHRVNGHLRLCARCHPWMKPQRCCKAWLRPPQP
jgi:hypothetical protein